MIDYVYVFVKKGVQANEDELVFAVNRVCHGIMYLVKWTTMFVMGTEGTAFLEPWGLPLGHLHYDGWHAVLSTRLEVMQESLTARLAELQVSSLTAHVVCFWVFEPFLAGNFTLTKT